MADNEKNQSIKTPSAEIRQPVAYPVRVKEYEAEMERLMEEHHQAILHIKRKNQLWSMVVLGILVLVIMLLTTTVGGWQEIYQRPDHVRVFLWACVACLLMGFLVARWLERLNEYMQNHRNNFSRRVKLMEEDYADIHADVHPQTIRNMSGDNPPKHQNQRSSQPPSRNNDSTSRNNESSNSGSSSPSRN